MREKNKTEKLSFFLFNKNLSEKRVANAKLNQQEQHYSIFLCAADKSTERTF